VIVFNQVIQLPHLLFAESDRTSGAGIKECSLLGDNLQYERGASAPHSESRDSGDYVGNVFDGRCFDGRGLVPEKRRHAGRCDGLRCCSHSSSFQMFSMVMAMRSRMI